ncbi:MAG: WD40 repeat domain-containing protein [Planctomycetales bacterium]|nr:WD40 repeat domain-containing protein [Planctomycetales bacterium]
MNSSKSSKDKSQSIGNILRVGFVGIVVTAICVWMVLPPLETFRFSKYDVSSQQELVMELTSIPDVGPRPMVAFSADGSTAAYLSKMTGTPPEVEFQSQVVVIEIDSAKQVAGPFPVANTTKPLDIAFSRDGTHLAVAAADEVRVWGLGDSTLAAAILLPNVRLQSQRFVAISHDGKRIATSLQSDDGISAICVFDSSSGEKIQTLERTAGTANDQRFAFHPTANQVIGPADSDGGDAHLCVWDAESGKIVNEIIDSEDCRTLALAFNDAGDSMAVAMYLASREYIPFATAVFKTDSWQQKISIDNEDYVFWVALNRDANQICLVDASGTASIWSTGEGNRLQNFKLGPPSATAFSSDGGTLRLVTNSKDNPDAANLVTLRPSE